MNENLKSATSSGKADGDVESEPPLAPLPRPSFPGAKGGRNRSSQKTFRRIVDSKVVGLKNFGMDPSEYALRHQLQYGDNGAENSSSSILASPPCTEERYIYEDSVEYKEAEVRRKAIKSPILIFLLGSLAAMKVLLFYLITIETLLSCSITVGLTIYWYYAYPESSDWKGDSLNFVLLAFALTAPIAAALTMAFSRRERALISIADFRSWSYHFYMAHCLWDWEDEKGGRAGADVDWLEHCDAVLAQLIGIGDELSRFLTLPTTSRSRHRLTRQGRREAARTIEVAYYLLESMATQRMTRLVMYSERLKKYGLPSGEASRLSQFERFISGTIEQLRMVKMYRTPQAFRSFARIFTLVLPPFYAPNYAQVGRDVNSLGVGIAFGIITALGLTALFESQQILEDPFTAYLALDGIDVREELEVLHFAQLIRTRALVFPEAPEYPLGRRTALAGRVTRKLQQHAVGIPPMQSHHNTSPYDLQSTELESKSRRKDHGDVELGIRMVEDDVLSCRGTGFVDTDSIASSISKVGRRSNNNSPLPRGWSRG